LKEENFDSEAKEIHLPAEITKTHKARSMPLSFVTVDLMRKLVSYKLKEWNCEYIFCTSEGLQMPTHNIQHRFRRVCERQHISITPYELRHIFATTFIRNGGDPFTLQKLLGHSKMDTTSVYVNLNSTDLKEKHREAGVLNTFVKTRIRKLY
jgi:integrase/recombinase XerD